LLQPWRQPPEHARGVTNEELLMAANLRAEDLEPQSERDLAPQLAVAAPASEPSEESTTDPTAESRHEAIARAAYYRAEARGFEPGHELDDWLAAEQETSSD
jgi:hypothetical protein